MSRLKLKRKRKKRKRHFIIERESASPSSIVRPTSNEDESLSWSLGSKRETTSLLAQSKESEEEENSFIESLPTQSKNTIKGTNDESVASQIVVDVDSDSENDFEKAKDDKPKRSLSPYKLSYSEKRKKSRRRIEDSDSESDYTPKIVKASPVFAQKMRTSSPEVHVGVRSEESEIEDVSSSDTENNGPKIKSPLNRSNLSTTQLRSNPKRPLRALSDVSPILSSPIKNSNTPLDFSSKKKKKKRLNSSTKKRSLSFRSFETEPEHVINLCSSDEEMVTDNIRTTTTTSKRKKVYEFVIFI